MLIEHKKGKKKIVKVTDTIITTANDSNLKTTTEEIPEPEKFEGQGVVVFAILSIAFSICLVAGLIINSLQPNYNKYINITKKFLTIKHANININWNEYFHAVEIVKKEYDIDPMLMISMAWNMSKFNYKMDLGVNGGKGLYAVSDFWTNINTPYIRITNANQLFNINDSTILAGYILNYYNKNKNYKDALYSYNDGMVKDFYKKNNQYKANKLDFLFSIFNDYTTLLEIQKEK